MRKYKKPAAAVMGILTAGVLIMGTAANAADFTDVSNTDWFCEAVENMSELGVINGTSPNTFEPYTNVTRAMFTSMLWRYTGEPVVNYAMLFGDVENDAYYTEAVRWAAAEEIVTGKSDKLFAPDEVITREQAAAMLYRFAKKDGCDVSVGENTNILSYDDAFSVSQYAIPALQWTVGFNVMSGKTDKTLNPSDNLTRAECARILYNYRTEYMNSRKDSEENTKSQISGTAVSVDHHGHVTTDISVTDFSSAGFMEGDIIKISVNGAEVTAPYCADYTDVDDDCPVILWRVDGAHISAAINMDSFADNYGVKVGDKLTFTMEKQGGYAQELELRSSVIYTFDRRDYPSDEAFANFREITAGNIKSNTLYRSSSLINPAILRNEYADKLCRDSGIKTIINLAENSEDGAKALDGYKNSYYSQLKDIYYCQIGLRTESEQFKAGLKKAFKAIADAQAPILIQCQQGRDQTGLTAALLECLCGADYNEVIDDYMLSYENLYNITHNSEQWQHIANGNIIPGLCRFAGADTEEELKNADLQNTARNYLKNIIGLSDEEIDAVYNKLCK